MALTTQKRTQIQDVKNSGFGKYSENTGGGEPIIPGEGRGTWEKHGRAEKRTEQPRTEDGKFTYNSVNGKETKYASRGETVNPLLTGGVNGIKIDSVRSGIENLKSGKIDQEEFDKAFKFYTDLLAQNAAFEKGDKMVTFEGKIKVASSDVFDVAKMFDPETHTFKGISSVAGRRSKAEQQAILNALNSGVGDSFLVDSGTGEHVKANLDSKSMQNLENKMFSGETGRFTAGEQEYWLGGKPKLKENLGTLDLKNIPQDTGERVDRLVPYSDENTPRGPWKGDIKKTAYAHSYEQLDNLKTLLTNAAKQGKIGNSVDEISNLSRAQLDNLYNQVAVEQPKGDLKEDMSQLTPEQAKYEQEYQAEQEKKKAEKQQDIEADIESEKQEQPTKPQNALVSNYGSALHEKSNSAANVFKGDVNLSKNESGEPDYVYAAGGDKETADFVVDHIKGEINKYLDNPQKYGLTIPQRNNLNTLLSRIDNFVKNGKSDANAQVTANLIKDFATGKPMNMFKGIDNKMIAPISSEQIKSFFDNKEKEKRTKKAVQKGFGLTDQEMSDND